MPQGRRKVPFSGKAKKEQLKAKKQSKSGDCSRKPNLVQKYDEEEDNVDVQKINYQPTKSGRARTNRYVLQFYKETDEEISHNKELSRQALPPVSEESLDLWQESYFPPELDFPKRPSWSYDMSKAELEARENKHFNEYIQNIQKQYSMKELSYFELNLETWRQLWRVLEMSDIVLFIVDIRFSALMFPPSIYKYVVEVLKKGIILVLNKVDLAPASLVVAWKKFLTTKYPDIKIVMFTTLPDYNLRSQSSNKAGLQIRRKKDRIRMAAEGTRLLFDAVESLVKGAVDLDLWKKKIEEEMHESYVDEKVEIENTVELKTVDTSYFEHEKYKDGILTIGCIGQPNVGKSSLINAIMGKKVVSVSKTPGHTKHFQTILITPNVKLCDCPGLVFPSLVPKPLKVLMGSFPIAQLREPYSTIRFLGSLVDLPKLLRINHPDGDDTWSAMDVCDGWAKKCGFYTAKAARLDSYRAANNILRMALDGKICVCLYPPNYITDKNIWENDPEVETVKWIQAKSDKDEQFEAKIDSASQSPSDSDNDESPNSEESVLEYTQSSGEEDSEDPTDVSANPFNVLQTCD